MSSLESELMKWLRWFSVSLCLLVLLSTFWLSTSLESSRQKSFWVSLLLLTYSS